MHKDLGSLENQIKNLSPLVRKLRDANCISQKTNVLDQLQSVKKYLKGPNPLNPFLKNLNAIEDYVVKAIIAIGQAPVVFNMKQAGEDRLERFNKLLNTLIEIEHFYSDLGGIVGYHLRVLTLTVELGKGRSHDTKKTQYIRPEGMHVDRDAPEVRESIRWGIESLNHLAEFYPLGGAGDRLNIIDETTRKPHPSALLPFLGRTLLDGLIRDLQAREYLYFKFFGKQIYIPIVIMTSVEKDNHNHIINIFNKNRWFGRLKKNFHFITQPLVPIITAQGNWALSSSLTLTLKPSGHGVIWKLAEEKGVFEKLTSQGYHEAIVRQINNPIASTDSALLALIGTGSKKKKSLGFLSCERLVHSAEGTNVLMEVKEKKGFSYRITNIEYTDFKQKGILDEPAEEGRPFSLYPTNTNILFVNIHSIQNALKKCTIPGQLINMKTRVHYIDPDGHMSEVLGGRLESTMQNIADYMEDVVAKKLRKKEITNQIQTYLIYNERIKTISTTKHLYHPGESPLSTPEQAYHDHLTNNVRLFKHYCQFEVPELESVQDYLNHGPTCVILFHPALGPCYSIIGQKIRKGRLAKYAELQLEVAEVDIYDLDLKGSLLVESVNPLGKMDRKGVLSYGNGSRLSLHKVKIKNKGINRETAHDYWKNQIKDREAVRIVLNEGSEFHAEDVTFEGECVFEVPANHRMIVTHSTKDGLVKKLKKIKGPTWDWDYGFDEEHRIVLTKRAQ